MPELEAISPTQRAISQVEEVPPEFRDILREIVALTDRFCEKHLDDEYKQICREMAVLVCQPGSPVNRGKRASWACGIAYSVGWVNFLTDPNGQPHMRAEEIAGGFGISTATMHNKAKTIREGLGLMRLDPEFTLPSRLEDNPLVWMLEVDGLVMDVRDAPREIQQAAFEQGLVPYIPADQESGPGERQPDQPRVGARLRTRLSLPKSDLLLQFKISLENTHPPIWRRIQVKDGTLNQLHGYTQTAFGWENYHLHCFEIGGIEYGPPPMDSGFPMEWEDESTVLLSELVPEEGKKKFSFRYEYDFGDGWIHTIEFEGFPPFEKKKKYPVCVEGKRACPPEDVGGPWGYAEFLEALADPSHEQHADFMEWADAFDPEEFDANKTTREMRRLA